MLRLSRPLHLLFITIAYILGVGAADHLGAKINIAAFWLGLTFICLAQISLNFLVEVFRPINEPILPNETRAERFRLRDRLLVTALGLLGLAATCAYSLYVLGRLNSLTFNFVALAFIIVFICAVPPFNLVRRGFAEFFFALLIGYMSLALGFLLQAEKFNRLLPVLALPLTLLAAACFIAFDFHSFASDIKYERLTLLTRLGWQRAVPLHHALVLAAFCLFAAAPLAGVSFALIRPAFFGLPFGILQILLLRNIANGAPPRWRALTLTAATLFLLTTYSLTITLFLH